MRELEKPVSRVFRRLRFQRFVTTLVWSVAIALFLVAGLLGTLKVLNTPLPGPEWAPFAAAGCLGLLVASLVAIFTGASRLDAAVAIDHAFHLNERLSSALTLPGEVRETPAGRAVVADATRKLADLDVTSAFRTRLPRRAWVVLIPAGLAVSMLFVPAWVPQKLMAKTETKLDAKVVAKQTEALTKKISSQRQVLDKEKFPEAEKLLAQIEKKAEDLAKAPPAQKDKLLVEMNKLTDALKERRKQLGSPEQVNRQLQQLKEMGKQGPADQMAKELARGDFKKAAEQLKQLQEKLQKGEMTQAEKKALQEQLGELSKKLKEMANLEQRKKQLDEALKNGGLSKEQHEREMEKLKEQSKSLQQLQQIAAKLGQAQEALKKGDTKEAAESLGMTQQQLAQMAKQLEEMEALDSAMADIQDAKNGMNDSMNQLGQMLDGMGNMDSMRRGMGNGLGRGRGMGDRPEAPDETATYTTRVQQQIKKGKAVLQGFTQPSKTIKGQSVIDIQGELEAATASAADALSNQRIPKNVEKHVRDYYDQLNKGK
jgi:DNA repair ATPase RecN